MSKHAAPSAYPNRQLVAEVLAQVAEGAAYESGCIHPEDIARAMTNAIDGGAAAIEVLWKRGVL